LEVRAQSKTFCHDLLIAFEARGLKRQFVEPGLELIIESAGAPSIKIRPQCRRHDRGLRSARLVGQACQLLGHVLIEVELVAPLHLPLQRFAGLMSGLAHRGSDIRRDGLQLPNGLLRAKWYRMICVADGHILTAGSWEARHDERNGDETDVR
jgi:hypothetical protein